MSATMVEPQRLPSFVDEALQDRLVAGTSTLFPLKHIVVAFDQNSLADDVLAWTQKLAQGFDARVWLVHAVRKPAASHTPAHGHEAPIDRINVERVVATQDLLYARKQLEQAGLAVETHVLDKWGPRSVARFAREVQADLIIVGAPHHSTLGRLFHKSYSDRLAGSAQAHVLLVRGPPSVAKIVIAVRDHPDSLIAVRLGLALSRQFHSVATVLQAGPRADRFDVPPSTRPPPADEGEIYDGATITYRTVGGRAAPAIASLAKQSDAGLIVVGTHPRRGLNRLVHRSVTRRLRRIHTPSILVSKKTAPYPDDMLDHDD